MNFVTGQSAGGKRIAIRGASLTAEAVQQVQQLRPGDKIIFEQILVVCRTCRVREWPPFTITIVGM
jgi:ASC-1-like (ASCH) protein